MSVLGRFRRAGGSTYGAALAVMLLALTVASVSAVRAQTPSDWDPTRTRASRGDIEALLHRYEQAAASPAYSDSLRAEAEEQAVLLRQRLDQGDFRAGDRIALWVEEHAVLTDTFDVAAGQTIRLPGVGTVQLAGVLRSELQERMEEAVARTIRDPRVRTQSMVRIAVEGLVTAPGHYLVDSDDPLSEVLMRGGGLAADARAAGTRVERGDQVIVEPEHFQQALRAGLTIDHLGIREGDRIFVPESRSGFFSMLREYILVLPALLGLLTLLG